MALFFTKKSSDEWLKRKMAVDKFAGNVPQELREKPDELLEQFEEEKKAKQARDAQGRFAIGQSVGMAATAGRRQRVDFSEHQENLRQMFGHGDKIWGVNNEPVRINHDLNPSRAGPDETSSMFGFGNQGERSGLF